MGLLSKIIGPKSKYKDDIPYTYEARIKIIDGDEYNSFFADTICALVEYLDKEKIGADGVEIYEIFKDKENRLNREYCVSEDGEWLSRKQLCLTFTERYPGHIHENCCTFEDRERDVEGP